jgi:flagellin
LAPEQRQALDREFQSLSAEIDRTSRSTSFNGQNLLDGSSALSNGQGKLQAGSDGSQQIDMPHTDLSLGSLNMGSAKVDSLDGAMQALAAIDQAMTKVSQSRADNGGLSNRLEHALNNLGNQMVNTTKGLSQIEDLDMAQGMTEKVRNDILGKTNEAALSQFNQISRTHLLALFQ